jgi:hypothetical protein
LAQNGLRQWETEIASMIDEHHRLRPIKNNGLVEIFRRADLIDFSLGLVRFDLPRSTVKSVRERFPNKGFHAQLARLACGWIVRHPFRPVPVLKW